MLMQNSLGLATQLARPLGVLGTAHRILTPLELVLHERLEYVLVLFKVIEVVLLARRGRRQAAAIFTRCQFQTQMQPTFGFLVLASAVELEPSIDAARGELVERHVHRAEEIVHVHRCIAIAVAAHTTGRVRRARSRRLRDLLKVTVETFQAFHFV